MLLNGLTQIFLKVLSDTSDDEYHFDELLPLHMRLNIKLRTPSKIKEYIDAWNEEIDYIQSVFDNMTSKKPKPPIRTEADRIRSMTDEELAYWIALKVQCLWCPAKPQEGKCMPRLNPKISCIDAVLDWLKQEITE